MNRRGQVVVEYILMCLVLVLVATAVLAPLRAQFAGIQNELAQNTLGVMTQDELGIPISWFELEASDDLKFQNLMSGLNGPPGGGDAGGGDPGGGDPGGGNPGGNRPNNGNDGGNNPSGSNPGGSGPNSPGTPNRSPTDNSNGGGDDASGSGGSSSGGSNNSGYKAGQTTVETSNRSGGASNSESSLDGSTSGSDSNPDSASGSGEGSEEEDSKDRGEVKKTVRSFDGREEESRKGGCENVDYSTLLKLFAIIGIVVIGAILMLSGRGGGKNNT